MQKFYFQTLIKFPLKRQSDAEEAVVRPHDHKGATWIHFQNHPWVLFF